MILIVATLRSEVIYDRKKPSVFNIHILIIPHIVIKAIAQPLDEFRNPAKSNLMETLNGSKIAIWIPAWRVGLHFLERPGERGKKRKGRPKSGLYSCVRHLNYISCENDDG